MRVALVEDDRGPAGYCILGPSRDGEAQGEAWTLFVDPGTWGAGLSDALIEDGLAWLAAAGFGSVTAWSFVDNRRANRFYQRYGFRDEGLRRSLPEFAGLVAARLARPLIASATRPTAEPG